MVRSPAAPELLETRLRRDPFASVSTLAVTPIPAALIAAASPDSVLLDEFRLTTCAFPLPTWIEMEPDSVSEAFVIGVRYPLAVCARLFTCTVCVPARAEDVADVSCSTFVLELDPVFCARVPVKSVSFPRSVDSVDNNVPSFDSTVS